MLERARTKAEHYLPPLPATLSRGAGGMTAEGRNARSAPLPAEEGPGDSRIGEHVTAEAAWAADDPPSQAQALGGG